MPFYDSVHDFSDFAISFRSNSQGDFGVFAKGYRRAASALAERLLERPPFPDYEAYPMVFLYRQALELCLEGFYYKAALITFFKDKGQIDCQFINRHQLKPLRTRSEGFA